MALTTITPAIEAQLLLAGKSARCDLDQRAAVLAPTSGELAGYPVAIGWNGLPGALQCSLALCSPGNKVGGCKVTAEHAEAMAIRFAALNGYNPSGMDMFHAKVVDGAIAVSRPPIEKTCKTCAVMMRSWGVSGIWLFVEGRYTEPMGQWTRWSVAEYYRLAAGCEVL